MITQAEMDKAQAVLTLVQSDWLKREGVTAVDLGFKWSHGYMTDQLAIRVHVEQKKAPHELAPSDLFPKEINGIPVDVIEATYDLQTVIESEMGDTQLEAAVDGRGERFDAVPLGVSIGCPKVTAGSLGAKVYDAVTREEMILSNWHVMVGALSAQEGDPVWQPGRMDGGKNLDVIANISRWVLGPYDACVAKLSDARPVLSTTIENRLVEDVVAPRLGMRVWKSGRTTGYTEGFIDGVMMTVALNYSAAGTRQIQSVMRIVQPPGSSPAEISMGGDSGSVWVDEESGKAVGLHFAGETGNQPEFALANDIILVARHLNVLFPAQLPAEEPPAPPEPPVEPTPDPTPPEPEPPVDEDPMPPPPPLPTKEPSFWEVLLQFFRNLFK